MQNHSKHDGIHLPCEFASLLKNIRNNWLTEKMGKLDEKETKKMQLGEMTLQMKGGQRKRYKHFIRYIKLAIHYTCNGIFSFFRSLCRISQNYVLLGTFLTDSLKKEVEKLHRGSGGKYFTTVQRIISKASPLLSNNVNADSFKIKSGHLRFDCSFFIGRKLG